MIVIECWKTDKSRIETQNEKGTIPLFLDGIIFFRKSEKEKYAKRQGTLFN